MFDVTALVDELPENSPNAKKAYYLKTNSFLGIIYCKFLESSVILNKRQLIKHCLTPSLSFKKTFLSVNILQLVKNTFIKAVITYNPNETYYYFNNIYY